MPETPLALTFDCYGTLIDWETGILAVLRPWALAEGLAVDDEALLAAFAQAEPAREHDHPFRPYPEVLRLVAKDIARSFGADAASAATREAAERLAGSVGDWQPFPDTVGALADLKRRFRLVIVSNVDRASFARTARSLRVPFDAVITAEDVRSYKPAPAHFHAALETLAGVGVDPSRVLHVAQSLYHDHVPARSLGLATAWVRRGRSRAAAGATRVDTAAAEVRPDYEADTLRELADLLLRDPPA